MFSARDPSDVDQFFRGLTEYAFHARLGVVDPPLVEYVAHLLVRFLRNERLALQPGAAAASTNVARLLLTVERHPIASEAIEKYRHIGDVTLFWSGLYPEAVARTGRPGPTVPLTGYKEAGRRAYWMASTLEPDDAAEERALFERLAHDYELCVEGLGEVRRAWGDRP